MLRPTSEDPCILVVDDDPDIREALAIQLRGAGYQVITAASEAEGSDRIAAGGFDLAVLDLMLEHMDSGVVLAHKVKRTTPPRPVIMLTAAAAETGLSFDTDTAEERRWLMADVLLDKPVRIEQLTRAIERLLTR